MLKHFKLANDLRGLQFDCDANKPYQNQLNLLKGLPFYCWDTSKFGFDFCCLQHLSSLPKDKDGIEKPLYGYERTIVDLLDKQKQKHVYILKATGLGITLFEG